MATKQKKFQVLRYGQLVSPVATEQQIKAHITELQEGEKRLISLGWVKEIAPLTVTTTTKRLGSW